MRTLSLKRLWRIAVYIAAIINSLDEARANLMALFEDDEEGEACKCKQRFH